MTHLISSLRNGARFAAAGAVAAILTTGAALAYDCNQATTWATAINNKSSFQCNREPGHPAYDPVCALVTGLPGCCDADTLTNATEKSCLCAQLENPDYTTQLTSVGVPTVCP